MDKSFFKRNLKKFIVKSLVVGSIYSPFNTSFSEKDGSGLEVIAEKNNKINQLIYKEEENRDYLSSIGVKLLTGNEFYDYKGSKECYIGGGNIDSLSRAITSFREGKDCSGLCVGGLSRESIFVIRAIKDKLGKLYPEQDMIIAGATETFDKDGCPIWDDVSRESGNVFYLYANKFSDEFYNHYMLGLTGKNLEGFLNENFEEFYGFKKDCIKVEYIEDFAITNDEKINAYRIKILKKDNFDINQKNNSNTSEKSKNHPWYEVFNF